MRGRCSEPDVIGLATAKHQDGALERGIEFFGKAEDIVHVPGQRIEVEPPAFLGQVQGLREK